MSDRTERLPAGPREVTARQLEVARLVAEGRTNEQIADALGISHAGAKYHVSELLSRLGLTRRDEIRDWYRQHRSTRRRRALLPLPLGALVAAGGVAVLAVAAVVLLLVTGGSAEEPRELPGLALGAEVEGRQSLPEVKAVFNEVEDGGIFHLRVAVFVRGGQRVQAGVEGDFFTLPESRIVENWWLYDEKGVVEASAYLVRGDDGTIYERGLGSRTEGTHWVAFPTVGEVDAGDGFLVVNGVGLGAPPSNFRDEMTDGVAARFRAWIAAGSARAVPQATGLVAIVRESNACGKNPLEDAPGKTHVVRKNEVDPATYFGTRSSCWAVMPDGSEVLLTSDAVEFHAIDATRWDEIETLVWPDGTPASADTP